MTATTDDILIPVQTPLAPGADVSSAVFDVSDARTVELLFSITSPLADVHWRVHFGPTPNNGYATARQGDFGRFNTIAISVPVFGTGVLVAIHNNGSHATAVDGNIRVIHEFGEA
ncbi:hypothetical protein [Microbacterium deminutum]|uniref:Uncharacterized protein n=1 Tax=Microbacterium deminutum TaxID=344164 RepID=A0ABN2RLQ3_9MICO